MKYSVIIHHYIEDTTEVETLNELLVLASKPNLDTTTKSNILNCITSILYSKSMSIELLLK